MTTTAVSSPPAARSGPLVWLERITSNFLLRRLAKALLNINLNQPVHEQNLEYLANVNP